MDAIRLIAHFLDTHNAGRDYHYDRNQLQKWVAKNYFDSEQELAVDILMATVGDDPPSQTIACRAIYLD